MLKIQKTKFMFEKGRQSGFNVRNFFSDKFAARPPFESKPEANSKLPSVIKNEDFTRNVPYSGISRFRNPITVPMMVSSFFNKTFNELTKELLLIEPVKNVEAGKVGSKQTFNTSAEFNEKGMKIDIEMKGFKEEDINVRVDGPWLVVEGQSSMAVPDNEGGGLHVRHIIRRYEVPPNSDVANIKSMFKDGMLTVTIPALTPKYVIGYTGNEPELIMLYFIQTSKGPALYYCQAPIRNYSTSNKESHSNKKTKEESKMRTKLCSIAHTDRGMHIFMDIKGFTKDNVQIIVEGRMLKILVENITKSLKKKGKDQKTLYRRYPIPQNLDVYNITAEINEDILKITVPSVRGEIRWK